VSQGDILDVHDTLTIAEGEQQIGDVLVAVKRIFSALLTALIIEEYCDGLLDRLLYIGRDRLTTGLRFFKLVGLALCIVPATLFGRPPSLFAVDVRLEPNWARAAFVIFVWNRAVAILNLSASIARLTYSRMNPAVLNATLLGMALIKVDHRAPLAAQAGNRAAST